MGSAALTQTIAVFRDAYRELNAKKLFWFVLAISALVVLIFATVGLTEEGFEINLIVWQPSFPSVFNAELLSPATFYKLMFVNLGIGIWLTWAASILALISVSGIIPDFIAGGSIELTLSKPISRLRLFLTKYVAALLFVALQVTVFTGAAFLLIGLRGGEWEPSVLLAIPIVLVFFSYLYCVCALFGLLTRSTIASLLLTGLVWLGFWGVGAAENVLLLFETRQEVQVEAMEDEIASRRQTIGVIESGEGQGGAASAILNRMSLEARKAKLAEREDDLERARSTLDSLQAWHRGLYMAKTILPKTSETIGLLDRYLITDDEIARLREQAQDDTDDDAPETIQTESGQTVAVDDQEANVTPDSPEVSGRFEAEIEDRPVWWVVGTSLAFEAVILAWCCFIFCRRDF